MLMGCTRTFSKQAYLLTHRFVHMLLALSHYIIMCFVRTNYIVLNSCQILNTSFCYGQLLVIKYVNQ